jgi:hypothetical protein
LGTRFGHTHKSKLLKEDLNIYHLCHVISVIILILVI